VSNLLFFDNKNLNNRIDWFIPCTMNANEISPKANARLKRIRIVSRVLKVLLLLYFFIPLTYVGYFRPFLHKTQDGFWTTVWGTYATVSDIPLITKLIIGLAAVLILAAVVTCYQLLSLYEKGIILSARNVRLLGRIGYLAVSYKLLAVVGNLMISAWYGWMGLYTFHPISILFDICQLLMSPLVIGGLFLLVVSRIMDEGRKIQEEQELTV
jgi:hypothetical protein